MAAKLEDFLGQLKVQQYFLKVNGLIPFNSYEFLPKYLSFLTHFERLIEWTFSLILIQFSILYTISFFKSFDKSLDEISGALTGTIIYGFASFISVYFKIRRQSFMYIFEYFSANMRPKSGNGFTQISMEDAYNKCRKISKWWGVICLAGVITMTFSPILMGKRDLPLKVWYPFDEKAKYVYETLYVVQALAQIQMCLSFSNSSGMYMLLVIVVCSQYDVLFCSMKNFVVTAELSANSADTILKDLEITQELANDEAQQYLYSTERKCEFRDVIGGIGIKHPPRNDDVNCGLRDALGNCVEHHLIILNLARQIESFFTPVCFVKILQMTIQLCLLAFVMIKSTDQDNAVVRVVAVVQYLALTIAELLILTYYGELITTQSLRLREAFMRSHWYLHATKVKQDILIILQNSVRPVVLTAGKIINLDIERFRLTITTAFSFITLLQKLDARK